MGLTKQTSSAPNESSQAMEQTTPFSPALGEQDDLPRWEGALHTWLQGRCSLFSGQQVFSEAQQSSVVTRLLLLHADSSG